MKNIKNDIFRIFKNSKITNKTLQQKFNTKLCNEALNEEKKIKKVTIVKIVNIMDDIVKKKTKSDKNHNNKKELKWGGKQ